MALDDRFQPRIAYAPAEVARLLGLSLNTIYREARDGRLQSFRVGARRLISAKALEEWLADRQAEATAAAVAAAQKREVRAIRDRWRLYQGGAAGQAGQRCYHCGF